MFVWFIAAKRSQMNSAWVRRRLNSSPRQFVLLCQMFFVQNIFFFVLEGSPTFSLHSKIIAFLDVARTKGKCFGLLSVRWEQAVLDVPLDGKYCTENGQHLVAPSRAEQSTDHWFIEVSNHVKRWKRWCPDPVTHDVPSDFVWSSLGCSGAVTSQTFPPP